ncbi:hypothetical protein BGZ72_001576 [Mortierella alpina]|nr:hypothetical protein BGZ72_001576 [Mortierella alpina]
MDEHSARVSYEMITEKLHKPAYAVITRNGQELGKDIGSFIHKFLESQRDHATVSKNVASDSSMDIDQEQVSDESHMQVEPDQPEEPQPETRAKTKEDYLAEVREEDLREARQGQGQGQVPFRSDMSNETQEQPKEQPQIPAPEESGSDMDIDSGDDEKVANEKRAVSRASDSSSMDLDSPGETSIILTQDEQSLNAPLARVEIWRPSTSARREPILSTIMRCQRRKRTRISCRTVPSIANLAVANFAITAHRVRSKAAPAPTCS